MLVSKSNSFASLAMLTATFITTAALAQSDNMQAMKMHGAMSPAMDGFCAVCLVEKQAWKKGDASFASNYDGHQYLFPGEMQKAMFDANPSKYAPVLGGDDVVEFTKTGHRTPGQMSEGINYGGRYYFFANDENKQAFKNSPEAYINADLAIDGECVICRVDKNHKVAGDPAFTALHNGMRYQFPNAGLLQAFTANPDKYSEAVAK